MMLDLLKELKSWKQKDCFQCNSSEIMMKTGCRSESGNVMNFTNNSI